jgi:hypothetical protein
MLKMRYDFELLNNYCDKNNIILKKNYSKEKINRDTIIEAKCLKCDDICSKEFRQFIKIGCFCKKHTKENTKEKFKATNIEKYGCEYPFQNEEVREKIKETCLEKYGVENPSQNEEVREKVKSTCLEKYGCEYPFQNEEVREKIKATSLEKYGVEYPFQNKEVRDKAKSTCLEKYGCEYSMQNAELSEKASKNAYKSYDYVFPSGRVNKIQGYEKYMLNELLQKEEIQEDDIIVNRSEVPAVWYEDINGKQRRYFVDCFIKSQNRCIEAKSTWTAEKKKDCIYLKQRALKDAGYLCEIWIYDGNGEIFEKII